MSRSVFVMRSYGPSPQITAWRALSSAKATSSPPVAVSRAYDHSAQSGLVEVVPAARRSPGSVPPPHFSCRFGGAQPLNVSLGAADNVVELLAVRYLRTKLATGLSPAPSWVRILAYPFRRWDPTYDYPYDKIDEWLIEFEEHGLPVREIGLDEDGQPVCAR